MKKILLIIGCFACCNLLAHSQAEELDAVRFMVLSIMGEWDDNVVPGKKMQIPPTRFNTYDDLFTVEFPSDHCAALWTPQERRTAFENFIAAIPELSTNGMYKGISGHGGVALGYCCNHGVTNVLDSAMRILVARNSFAKNMALEVFEKFAIPSDEVNAFAAQILMNKTAETEWSRKYFLGAYATVLAKHRLDCAPMCFTNGVSIVKSGVYGWAGAIPLDQLLLEAYPGYEMSSNRLEIAISALKADYPKETFWDWASSIKEYFAPITNQLLTAAQPLAVVEALRDL